jgi:hypothetical protein
MFLCVFKKNQILAQNSKGLAFGFTKKTPLCKKTDRNSVFLGRKAHIPYRLSKNATLRQKLIETLYFLVAKSILWIGYT